MRKHAQTKRRGFTLIELVLVIMILAILAGFVVPMIGGLNQISTPGGPKSHRQIVTETTMRAIRDAIMGTETRPGAWGDLGQRPELFPRNPNYLLLEYPAITAVSEYSALMKFDPVTKIGWRGPYLTGVSRLVDAWGNEFEIHVDFDDDGLLTETEVRYARLVSLGENGVLDAEPDDGFVPGDNDPADNEISLEECGDDIVLFFRVADTRQ